MNNLNLSKVKLEFEFVPLHNKVMTLSINNNVITPNDNNRQTTVVDITLPGAIVLEISGKDLNNDTVVDASGNIIADKHIKLIAAEIDGLQINPKFLLSWPQGNNIKTSYFGFNGNVILQFDDANSFYFSIKSNI